MTTNVNIGRYNYTSVSGNPKKKHSTEPVPVNFHEMVLAYEMFRDTPVLKIGLDFINSKIFECPFEIIISTLSKKIQFPLNNEYKEKIIKKYWMKWVSDFELWDTLFGVVPYYLKSIEVNVKTNVIKMPDIKGKTLSYEKILKRNKKTKRSRDDNNNNKNKDKDKDQRPTKKRKTSGFNSNEDREDQFIKFDIQKKKHFVPFIPPLFSGYIETYFKDDERQFIWKWFDDDDDELQSNFDKQNYGGDKKMYWGGSSYPDINGNLTTKISTLIKKWSYIKTMKKCNLNIYKRMANPFSVIEFHPSGSSVESILDDIEGTGFSSLYPGMHISNLGGNHQRQSSHNEFDFNGTANTQKYNDRSKLSNVFNFYKNIYNQECETPDFFGLSYNLSNLPRLSNSAMLKSQLELRRLKSGGCGGGGQNGYNEDKSNMSVMGNVERLKPFQKYIPVAPPQPINEREITDKEKQFNKEAAISVNFPLEMIIDVPHEKAMGNFSLFMNDIIKKKVNFYRDLIENVWKESYMTFLINIKDRMYSIARKLNPTEWHFIDDQLLIEVIFTITPQATYEDMQRLYSHGFINAEQFKRFSLSLSGILCSQNIKTSNSSNNDKTTTTTKKSNGPSSTKNNYTKKLDEIYDLEEQHKQQMKWAKQEIKAGLVPTGGENVIKNTQKNESLKTVEKRIGLNKPAPQTQHAESEKGKGEKNTPEKIIKNIDEQKKIKSKQDKTKEKEKEKKKEKTKEKKKKSK